MPNNKEYEVYDSLCMIENFKIEGYIKIINNGFIFHFEHIFCFVFFIVT